MLNVQRNKPFHFVDDVKNWNQDFEFDDMRLLVSRLFELSIEQLAPLEF
jgi:hypothetical protein